MPVETNQSAIIDSLSSLSPSSSSINERGIIVNMVSYVTSPPVFSPSRVSSFFTCKPSSSPEILMFHLLHRSPPTPQSSSLKLHSNNLKQAAVINGFRDECCDAADESGLDCSSGLGSHPLLERKRPTMLQIPVASVSSMVDMQPGAGDTRLERLDEVADDGEGFSVYSKRGRKGDMEDRFSAFVDTRGDTIQAFFGVFDGHGGANAVEFAAKNMSKHIMAEVSRRRCEDDIAAAVRDGYLTTDAEFLKEDVGGGACCLTALVHNDNLVVSNAGDCRAVMSRKGIAEALTSDHKPSREDEKERIEALGGYVDCCHGVWRIQGTLAVSRGIGDRHLKQWVTAQPETKILKMTPECEFVILASDGLWDKVTNQEAVDIVRSLCINVDKPDPASACKELAELSVLRGSNDDTTVMVIQLSHYFSQVS